MKTFHLGKKSITAALAAAAAFVAPAVLFLGAGSAQAGTWVDRNTDALGVTVHVHSFGGSYGWCTYSADPSGVGVPVHKLPFYLEDGQVHDIWFPGIQTGQTWDVTVDCPNGVDSPPQPVVY
jgi:hypothetical protein